jgi:hypothetical protein
VKSNDYQFNFTRGRRGKFIGHTLLKVFPLCLVKALDFATCQALLQDFRLPSRCPDQEKGRNYFKRNQNADNEKKSSEDRLAHTASF